MGEEDIYPSFLSPVRTMPAPTLLDLEQYFPGESFWKLALIEQYSVTEADVKELQEKGWQEVEPYEQSPLVFRLTSQLNLVLALIRKEGRKSTISLWAKLSDIGVCPR